MKKILSTCLVGLIILIAIAGAAQAQISATVHVKDINNNIIDNQTVHINTKVIVYGYYEDLAGTSSATGKIDVYLDQGAGFALVATIWGPSTIADGQTISAEYTLTQEGTYQFRWTVQYGAAGSCVETAQARTRLLITPEPATLAALGMSLAALGLFAYRKKRAQ